MLFCLSLSIQLFELLFFLTLPFGWFALYYFIINTSCFSCLKKYFVFNQEVEMAFQQGDKKIPYSILNFPKDYKYWNPMTRLEALSDYYKAALEGI